MPTSRAFLLAFGLLLVAFTAKGMVFVTLIPPFHGSDEYVHYSTVQVLAEPVEKNWDIVHEKGSAANSKQIALTNYTEEIRELAAALDSELFAGSPYNTPSYAHEVIGATESLMYSGELLPYADRYPAYLIRNGKLTHVIASFPEKVLQNLDFSFFERYAAARLIAILYGVIIVLCAYFIALWSGLRKEHSLLVAAIVAFHPQLTATTAIINYDPLLIAAASVVFLAAVSILRHGLNTWNTLGIIIATAVAFLAKSTGGVLFFFTAGILFWGVRERVGWLKRQALWKIAITTLVLFGIIFVLSPEKHTSIITTLPMVNEDGETAWESAADYLDGDVFDSGKFERTSVTYWGTFGWLDTTLHGSVMSMIRGIQYIGFMGTAIFFLISAGRALPLESVARKAAAWTRGYFSEVRAYLPEAKYAWLFLFSIVLLQAAVRFYDWYGQFIVGDNVGTPGRYFLPNIIPHFMLLVIGFGMLVRSERALGLILRAFLVLMVLLNLYSVFWIIIPRYYL